VLLAVVVLAVPLGEVFVLAGEVGGAAALASAVLALRGLRTGSRRLAGALVAAGLITLGVAVLLGSRPGAARLLQVNQGVVGMIAAVSFLQLVAPRGGATAPRPGRRGVWRTAAVLHGLGSAINLAIVDIVGRHLERGRALRLFDGLLLSRAFSSAAMWSPFWASSATALTYAPAAQPLTLLACGLLLAAVAMTLSLASLVRSFPREARAYEGYAITPRMLALPGLLLVGVLGGHRLVPEFPVSTVVLVAAMTVTVAVLLVRSPRRLGSALRGHVRHGLPHMRGEVALFTAAGVLSVGLSTLVGRSGLQLPVEAFTVPVAWASVAVMAAVSLVGVHPVISIATLAVLLDPVDPDPTLFALASVIAWGCAAAVGPVTGLNVYLSGRFDLDAFRIARHNLGYVALVVVLALPVLSLSEWLR